MKKRSRNWLMVGFLTIVIAKYEEVEASRRLDEETNLDSDPTLQPHRTAYHFQPPKFWMNDPNGPMYYNGVYHLFYQYNPRESVWGDGKLSWGHSISYNLVDWVHLENAINPTDPFDINGCWSGSATILPDGTPAILYTGCDPEKRQVQNLAVAKNASDPYLREWIKSDHNPLLAPVDDIKGDYFRDPTTAWQGPDGKWRLIVGSEICGHGTALLYHSEDFVSWTKSHRPLHFSKRTKMWECPDFYPVSVNGTNGLDTSVIDRSSKHVLKASFNDHDYYVIGAYEPETDAFSVDTDFMDDNVQLRYDYGVFYASKTFYDNAKRRRILWGWVTEADGESDDTKKGWSGLQSFPRSILLDESGKQLTQWPIREIESLRTEEVNIQNKEIEGGAEFEITGITASQADVEVSFHIPNLDDAELLLREWRDPEALCRIKNASAGGKIGPFGLMVLASDNLAEHADIFFRIYKGNDKHVVLMCSDQSRSSLREEVEKTTYGAFIDVDPSQNLSLRSLIDHSIIESFGGRGKTCITARAYPKVAVGNAARLYAFNYGTESIVISSLSAWSMKPAQLSPLHERTKSQI
ncbi:OLC1v1025182C1 [Oldenlandia corymbosa var. corymbosa]|uniref:OLC1v1025182C1 n=1 Tax=Oldenlandia corymbosa var. corymbosa TaxID=529605 RepID=A0AAV1CGU7_OLDCO|nr:OLC1v1025182C1 [Oldenlandia corymbosa var. corymbosa]